MKNLQEIARYEGGISSIPGKKNVIKLSSNESPFGPSKSVIRALSSSIAKTNRYPDGNCLELRKAISKKFKINTDNIFCGNGSDEILGLVCQLFLNKGDEVIIPEHSFLMYEIYTRINNGKVQFASTKNLKFQVDAILNKINQKTKIIFIAQPNNPTGLYLSKKDLNLLVSKVPKKIKIVIDTAYAEYMTDYDYSNGIYLAKKNKNLIVTRTFSKIYGLASLRLGWCYAHKDIIKLMDKIRGPFNVNHSAQIAGIAAINDKAYEQKMIKHNKFWLNKMHSELRKLPVEPVKSRANFILIKVGKNANKLTKYLMTNSIIVRKMTKYKLDQYIRVSVGKAEENKKFIEAIRKFYS